VPIESTKMAEEEWENPWGLTKEYAISIDGTSDDEVGKRSCVVEGADKVANTKVSEELQYYESRKQFVKANNINF